MNRKGFTFIELIIVVLIIAVVGGAIIGRMLSGIEKSRLTAAANQVASHIKLAQERSKLEQRAFTVEFNATDETYAVYQAALNLNGSSDSVSIPDSDNVTDFSVNQDFAVSFWVKNGTGNANQDAIVEKWNGTGGYSYVFRFNSSNSVSFGRYDSTNTPTINGTTSIADTNWHHVAGVKQDSKLTLYIDNASGGTATDTTTGTTTNSSPLYLGSRGGASNFYAGAISELCIYSRAITAGEVSHAYTYKKSQSRAGLTGWWKLDEGQGASAADLSGNGNTGTITGGTSTQSMLGYLKDPAKNYQDINYDFDNLPEFSGVKISTVDFDATVITNSSKVSFDSLGRPRLGTESLSASGTVVLTCGDQTATITVNKSTGEVKIQ